MDMLMHFASLGAKTLQTVSFTANGTWVAPVGVNLLLTLVGQGAPGVAASTVGDSDLVVDVNYEAVGTGTAGSSDWTTAQNAANFNLAQGTPGGSVTFQRLDLIKYGDGTETASVTNVNASSVVAASAHLVYTGAWQASGAIAADGAAYVYYDVLIPATTGASSTAFGHTFVGGTGGAATPVSYTNEVVVPSTSYPIVVPSGGSVTITYYA